MKKLYRMLFFVIAVAVISVVDSWGTCREVMTSAIIYNVTCYNHLTKPERVTLVRPLRQSGICR